MCTIKILGSKLLQNNVSNCPFSITLICINVGAWELKTGKKHVKAAAMVEEETYYIIERPQNKKYPEHKS